MKFETKYFGTVEVPPDEVITFPNGLFGFEEERSFLLLPFAGSDGNMLCLQSAATPSLAFIAMNPFSLHPSYQPLLSSEELREMEVKDSHALCYYVLCVVREPVQESTLNFKCPVVVNPDSRRAIQVILESDAYHIFDDWRGYQYHGSLCGLRWKCEPGYSGPQRDADPPQRAAAGRLLQPGGRPEPLYSTAPRVSGVCVPQGGGCNPAVGSAQMILKDWRQVE